MPRATKKATSMVQMLCREKIEFIGTKNHETLDSFHRSSCNLLVGVVCMMISRSNVRFGAIVFLLLAGLCVRGLAQRPVAPVGVEIRGFVEPGYFIAAPLQQDTLVVIDEYARPLMHSRVGLHTNVASASGRYVTHFGGSRRERYFVRRDGNLRAIDTFRLAPPAIADFHEGKVWTDTSMILLGFEEVTMDLTGVVPGGQPNATVLVGVIEEQTFDGRVVFRWKSIDHIALTESTSDIDLTQNYIDYIHINSIWRDTNGDLLVSCRHTDQVIRIDRTSGQVLWRLGGGAAKRNDFRFLNDTIGGFTGFSHQHTALRTPRGTIMMFDNGNLKPEPRLSRVVEYEINEVARTVRAIRSIIPDSVGFVPSMGNVEELPGGNIIVGYGSESGRILAHEIDRDGRIVATVRNITAAPIDPYRVVKARVGMTAVIDTITATGSYNFVDADSSTGVSILVSKHTSNVIVAAERHHTRPPVLTFSGRTPEHVLPMRWVLRYAPSGSAASIEGTTQFDAGVLPRAPSGGVSLYGRDSVGGGPFVRLNAAYDSATRRFTLARVMRGEIIAAVDSLPAPLRLGNTEPTVRVSPDAAEVVLSMPAADVHAEVSYWPLDAPDSVNRRVLRQRPDATAAFVANDLLPERTYAWAARLVGSTGAGADSLSWHTRTLRREEALPGELEPEADVFIQGDSIRLSWKAPRPLGKILVQVTPSVRGPINGVDFTQVRLDTVDAAIEGYDYGPLEQGMTYFWRVLYLDTASSSPWSPLMGFATPPSDGQALMPMGPINGRTITELPVRLAFTTSPDIIDYEVQLSQLIMGRVITSPISVPVADPGEILFDDLTDGATYFWRVIGKGSDLDTGHVAMFRVQRSTSARTRTDPTAEGLTMECIDGQLRIHCTEPPSHVDYFDMRGRMLSATYLWDGQAISCDPPPSTLGWFAVRLVLADGSIRVAVPPCR
ncbi:MAG: hypothetical protein FGM33_05350 [Candidatus Kapabacteria bacterium]|nr:hypothetical protein [Candidatus Kapabacteria bacterium]